MRGNPQALFGKRPTEKDLAKGTSPAVDFTRREAVRKRPEFTRGERGTSPGGRPYFSLPIGMTPDLPIFCLSALRRPVAVRHMSVRTEAGWSVLCMFWILSYQTQCSLTWSGGAFMARAG